MKQFSNRYIFIFSSVMVIAVAALLSLAATLLQPAQEKNLEIEKKKSMLESIGVPATRNNTEELYDKYIKESFVDIYDLKGLINTFLQKIYLDNVLEDSYYFDENLVLVLDCCRSI